MICFDTNAVIAVLNSKTTPVRERLQKVLEDGLRIHISMIVYSELWYGVFKSARPDRNAARIADFMASGVGILDFDVEDAREAGDIRAALAKAGTPIGPYDVLIAAQARRREAILVTANGREFSRVPGLKTEDWATPLEN
jgi:tRNA(fMet)-specific endonuclease VapC